jgi:hypothetical protein
MRSTATIRSDRLLLGSQVGDLSLPIPQLYIAPIDVLLCDLQRLFIAVGLEHPSQLDVIVSVHKARPINWHGYTVVPAKKRGT